MKINKTTVNIPVNSIELEGILTIPSEAKGLVIFSHGAGSSRLSPRNNYVADVLNQAGIATLLFDLLTEEEDQVYENRFDITRLTERLIAVTKWIGKQKDLKALSPGYFGSSTGAASALNAAAELGESISAVVSRGGRPDLAMENLPLVKAPTLLIVGGWDDVVIGLNEQALAALTCEKKLEIVPGATHLFEEPGKLEEAAELASKWFQKYL
ncbi:dienelactone hydrolase family protein [Patescibacteria group bacterium]|nr:dienelactone hydrolase family protein [Patescibacteria group bacterium]MBU1015807.1 dienelactone hydrolase family protein [Patescibacteria group bacterium]MBU1685226.1 dienelactone hydrolase family protein [Patescibacteria group bacterium]MBU1938235.1 dienelactone hydrolase family protein [Patescibacteria group bacterium]